MKEIIISPLEAGQRLDRMLGRYLSNASTGFLYKMLRKKNITLNGRKADGSEKLSEGDVVRLFFAEETLQKFTGSTQQFEESYPAAKLDIIYEDAGILLINKPAGMLTQKAAETDISLNEYAIGYLLREHAVTADDLQTFKPSVCNRLDRNTSGIVAVGKTTAGLQMLSKMFRERTVHKYYQALVIGDLQESGTIKGYLRKDEKTNKVTVSASERSAHAIETRYRPAAHSAESDDRHALTLLEIELITGKTHQIRAHLSSIGHPIVGDPKYGSTGINEYFRREYRLRYQLLHAGKLVMPDGRIFTAELPPYFQSILKHERVH